MGLANKFVGGGRIATDGGGNFHQGAASRASRMYAHLSPSTASSSTRDNRVADVTSLGTKSDTAAISSHNDINRFTSGISEHHPYKERGGAFDQTKRDYQQTPARMSDFRTPSGGGTGKRGSSSATMRETRAPAPYDNPMKENAMPSDPSKKGGSPGGPRGGTQALMNRMKGAGVNKMAWRKK
jgi:hypothetical protein